MGSSFDLDRAAGSAAKPAGMAAPDAVEESPAPASVEGAPGTATLALTPPQAVAMIDPPQAAGTVKLEPSTVAKLDAMVADYVVAISQLDTKDPKFEARMSDVRNLGSEEIKASAQVSSRLLNRPIGSMKKGGTAGSVAVADNLVQLRRQIEALDPGHQGDLFGTRKLLGMIPFGDRLAAYFSKYQSSQGHINAIVAGLESGKRALAADNTDLEAEKANLWQTMERLRQYLYLAQKLDAFLSGRIEKMEAADPDRARILKDHVLFYVRQKAQDLTAQMAVSVQGYLSIDVIRSNNNELMRGVDRATTTTISALRTAVIVAQALGDQKLVLDQITALNSTTSNMIESTSAMLRQQSAAVGEQAASSMVDLQKLQTAFDNIYATIDEIDSFKIKSLDSMSKTISALSAQLSRAQTYVDRANGSRR